MDRNVANVFHTAEDTQGPCKRCQHHTGGGDIVVHRRESEVAGLSRVSVQILYALDIKTKAIPLETSVKAKVTKLRICPQEQSKIDTVFPPK